MSIDYSHEEACSMAAQLGAAIQQGGDGWTYAVGFPSPEVAWHFQTVFNGMESEGAFPNGDGDGFTVYFRSEEE
jgi:hypothetical protein